MKDSARNSSCVLLAVLFFLILIYSTKSYAHVSSRESFLPVESMYLKEVDKIYTLLLNNIKSNDKISYFASGKGIIIRVFVDTWGNFGGTELEILIPLILSIPYEIYGNNKELIKKIKNIIPSTRNY